MRTMISFCVILFTFLLEIPLLLASEIHCETDMDNPIPFGSDVSVTCESKVEELIGLSIKRPGPSKIYNVKMLPSSTRLKMIKQTKNSYAVKISESHPKNDSGKWQFDAIYKTDDGFSHVKEILLDLQVVNPEHLNFYSQKPGYETQILAPIKTNPQPKLGDICLKLDGTEVNLTTKNVVQTKAFHFDLTLVFKVESQWIEKDGQLKIGKSRTIPITLYDLSYEELYERAKFKKLMIGVGVVIGLILCVMFYVCTVRHRGSGLISTSSKLVFWFRNRFADIEN